LDGNQSLTAELKALVERKDIGRRAWVNLWDVRSSHAYLLVPSSDPGEIHSIVRRHAASLLGLDEGDVTVSTTIGDTRAESGNRRKTEASFFAAGSDDIHQRLQPIVDAGVLIEGVTTPCSALWSQATLRRPSLGGGVHAYVALGGSKSALGIFSNGAMLYARDLDWGYVGSSGVAPLLLSRGELARRLSTELRSSFLYLKQYWEEDVSQVLLCGDLPEIRSLTAPLIERLNIEVETLDTLQGVDPASVPPRFADQAAACRLALCIAAAPPPVNLLPVRAARERFTRTHAILAVATVAAMVLGAVLYNRASVARAQTERQITQVQRELTSLQTPSTIDAEMPALARVFAALANTATKDVTVKSLRASREADHFRVTVEAVAAGPDIEGARAAADVFLRELQRSTPFGAPVEPPTERVAPGVQGIEIAAVFRTPR
jgi:hypothetical protein